MKKVRLIHWNNVEAAEKARLVKEAGFDVDFSPISPSTLKEIRIQNPEVIIIDLSRLPSQGRDIALNFRHYKSTRMIPLVFTDGIPEKVGGIKKLLPDAVFTEWKTIKVALKRALTSRPLNPAPARSVFDAYAGRPLTQKLGIKAGMRLLLINAPPGYKKILGPLPEKAKIVRVSKSPVSLAIWFVGGSGDLEKIAEIAQGIIDNGALWIAWSKKGSTRYSGLNQTHIRKAGLDIGLVDYKICSIDESWSALKFAWRKKKQVGK